MTTITIPARIVRVLRESLHSQLGMAAEDIGQASHEGGRRCPHLYAEPVERFDRTRALLDLMGWKETEGTARPRSTSQHIGLRSCWPSKASYRWSAT
jgi:hypothetical protein